MSSLFKIERVAVLGTGVMGSQIAAHLTNAKIPVYAFDISQDVSQKGLDDSLKLKPSAYYNPKSIDLITPLNYNDDLDKISECDWVIEVIAERLDWKIDLYKKIRPFLKSDAIVTSNTSGISISALIEGMDGDMASNFFITHFFNPPRYMKLVEVILSSVTNKEIVPVVVNCLEGVLGKGVVYAKDTPNFIANRIGVYGMMATLEEARKRKISIEDVDLLTGSLIGRPKSATFRTADVVGLDTMCFVANTAYENCINDSERDIFKIPEYLKSMVDNGWVGQKSGQGFYKKIDKGVIHSLDLETLEYSEQKKKRYSAVRLAKENINLVDRLSALISTDDVAGDFVWALTARALIYSANRIGEVSDDILNIDRAMKWGFGWELGPFEIWDALGFVDTLERMVSSGYTVPKSILKLKNSGFTSFYKRVKGVVSYLDIESEKYIAIKKSDKEISFNDYSHNNGLIEKHWSASIVDLGDGVAGVNLHSVLQAQLNPIDGSVLQTLFKAQNWVAENGYKGLVISSDSSN